MTVNSTRDFIPPEPFEGQNYKPRYARPSASLCEETRHCINAFYFPSRKTTLYFKASIFRDGQGETKCHITL